MSTLICINLPPKFIIAGDELDEFGGFFPIVENWNPSTDSSGNNVITFNLS
jgi:hypothetical protein